MSYKSSQPVNDPTGGLLSCSVEFCTRPYFLALDAAYILFGILCIWKEMTSYSLFIQHISQDSQSLCLLLAYMKKIETSKYYTSLMQ